MNSERWEQVKSIVGRALELTGERRLQWLSTLTISNPDVAAEARRLVLQSERDEGCLEPTAAMPGGSEITKPSLIYSPGQLLASRFEIQDFLGAGGMGEVYSALDRERGQLVALKTLRTEYSRQSAYLTRLKKEVQLTARLRHPNLCHIHDLHRVPSVDGTETVVLTMELLSGETLAQRIRRSVLDWREAHNILRQLVAGLSAAHEAGILHRDLKSGNIMLLSGDTPKAVIMDFGLAREIASSNDTQSLFGPNAIVGTPSYMAPEQLRGQGASKSTDIYSLGVVAFEMVTGRLPFEGETALAIALRRLKQEAPSARQIVRTLPLSWDAGIQACLAAEPKNRPKSAHEFLLSLEKGDPAIIYWSRRHGRRTAFITMGITVCGCVAYFMPHAIHHPAQAIYHYQHGEEFLRRGRGDDIKNAIDEFHQAIATDPNYPEALAKLAAAYCLAAHYDFLEPKEARNGAKQAGEQALRLNQRSALALGAIAYAQSIDFARWRQAEPAFERAFKADPNEPLPHAWFAAYLGRLGRFKDAILEASKAVSLDSGSFYNNHQLAYEYFRARRFQEFYRQAKELLHLQPTESSAFLSMARACEWLRRFDEGLQYCAQAELYGNKMAALCYRGLIEAARGNEIEAERLARQVEEYGGSILSRLAC